ncbi:hypothetical protein ACH5RR_036008 [Cinchona calisaya]|uniref:Uncharacterized protein n=1 Tax=Cinchona calisaya TaxID=153742 RepID=A0ABD2Y6R9_9GENT
MTVPVKIQIQSLEEKLRFSRNSVDFAVKYCNSYDKLEDFLTTIQTWSNNAACMSLLYWIDGLNENMVSQLDAMLSDMISKNMPYDPLDAKMYLGIVKASKSLLPSDTLEMGKTVASFVELLLENLALSFKDHCEMLREGLIFLITSLVDPPKECKRKGGNLSWTKVDNVNSLVESLICLLCTSKERDLLLSDLLEKIERVKAEVRELYLDPSNSSEYNFPKTNGMGFIDFLTGHFTDFMECEASFIPFAKDKVMMLHSELLYFRSFLDDIINLQNEHEEVKTVWTQIISVAYQVENIINSCSIVDVPIWYNIIRFNCALEEVKAVRTEVMRMKQKYNIGKRNAEINTKPVHPSRVKTSKVDEDVVGFRDEANAIIELLNRPSKKLEIVSIIGMPGVGKTTLAKKVYDDPSIAFHKRAWCFVSQVYTTRDLLLGILKSVGEGIQEVEFSKDDQDLAALLQKCLRRNKYLVVMDNIWDFEAWNAVRLSFPDDGIGSRVIFTTQNCNLSLDTELRSHSYQLSPLAEEKSWDFLREKLFHKGGCSQELSKIGKQIVRYCEGLPLAITVIAGLLAKEKENVKWWKQVEKSLRSNDTSEGYMGTLELSFIHLTDTLKPCFLYFGAFQKGEVISARKLILLWSAEGFIKRTEMKSFIVVAKEYLNELINLSLVIVYERCSNGGIKACRVHDLLHNFCSEKAKEENFLHVVERSEISHNFLNPKMHGYCRLCIHTELETFMSSEPPCPHVCSLLYLGTSRWDQSYSSHFFNNFKILKVLNLDRVCLDCSFPEEIISIVHLRYLAIWGYITSVPASLANLWKLETLIIKGMEYFIHFPDTIWKMKSLKHVDVSEAAVLSLGDYEDEESCQLSNIETFASVSISHGGDTEKLLGRLSRLQKLRCVFRDSKDYRKKGIQFPALTSLKDLESLKVSTNGSHEQVFYCWMRIQFKGFNFPSKLKKLTLYKLGLPWRAMSTLRELCNLEVLKLRQQAFLGKTWDMEDEEFENLKLLELSNLDIVHWKAGSNPFPRLERLVIRDCYELEEIPLSFADIYHFEKIQLQRCNREVENSAMQILKAQQEMGDVKLEVHVFH